MVLILVVNALRLSNKYVIITLFHSFNVGAIPSVNAIETYIFYFFPVFLKFHESQIHSLNTSMSLMAAILDLCKLDIVPQFQCSLTFSILLWKLFLSKCS